MTMLKRLAQAIDAVVLVPGADALPDAVPPLVAGRAAEAVDAAADEVPEASDS